MFRGAESSLMIILYSQIPISGIFTQKMSSNILQTVASPQTSTQVAHWLRIHLPSRRCRLEPWVRKIPWRWKWQPFPIFMPGKSHGWRSLVGCSPWGREESNTTERLHFHFSLSCIGEGNGNPLQYSGLQNPRDWGAWWAAVYGVA